MSALHRPETAFGPRLRSPSAPRLRDPLASKALLALMVARLAVRVARHALRREPHPGGPADAAR